MLGRQKQLTISKFKTANWAISTLEILTNNDFLIYRFVTIKLTEDSYDFGL